MIPTPLPEPPEGSEPEDDGEEDSRVGGDGDSDGDLPDSTDTGVRVPD